ncbi:hypothetical protein [Cytobacillus horneckiae]|uniref:hypothetical protein n=1 Tax=Cytobacillus horneckiae TaxID=549687 RepID=UPI003D9AA14B
MINLRKFSQCITGLILQIWLMMYFLFRYSSWALEVRATEINREMKIAAPYAIASFISNDEWHEDYIIPNPFNKKVAKLIAEAAVKTAGQPSSRKS